MKRKHIKSTFTFKPRLSNSKKRDYDAIFTEILSKDKSILDTERYLSSNDTYSTNTSNTTKAEIKKVDEAKGKRIFKSQEDNTNNNSYLDYTLTTTKYITIQHKSVLIPTVIAVISKADKASRFEKKNTLSEKRNRHLIEKKTVNTVDEKNKSVLDFDINTLSEAVKDMNAKIRHKNSDEFFNKASTTLLKSPSNFINQIHSKIKKNKTYKI